MKDRAARASWLTLLLGLVAVPPLYFISKFIYYYRLNFSSCGGFPDGMSVMRDLMLQSGLIQIYIIACIMPAFALANYLLSRMLVLKHALQILCMLVITFAMVMLVSAVIYKIMDWGFGSEIEYHLRRGFVYWLYTLPGVLIYWWILHGLMLDFTPWQTLQWSHLPTQARAMFGPPPEPLWEEFDA